MERNKNMGLIHTITEGGQLSTHTLRMLKQVFKVACLIALLVWMILFLYCMSQLPHDLYENTWYHLQAQVSKIFSTTHVKIDSDHWMKLTGHGIDKGARVATQDLLYYTQPYADYLETLLGYYAEKTGMIAAIILLLVFLFFFIQGRLSSKKEHIAGNQISPAWKLALRLKLTGQASTIRLGKLPLAKGTETQHILVIGGTGSGKTNCFHHIMPQIRSQGQQAIIIDTTGDFVERYYCKNHDVILNPFDQRTVPWHPWVECKNTFDYETLAESFIHHRYSEHDHYWHTAARALFSSALIKLEASRKVSELTRWLLYESLPRLATLVQGTKAASHLDLNSERTAGSVRSVASSFLSCLELIGDTNSPFSIREWIQSNQKGSWLFLSCKPSQRSALNPLLACWFSIAMRSLLLLDPDLERRIWFIIDELPSLHRLNALESFLSESRKYGGCALLAIQSPSQLDAIYGPDVTHAMIGNCGTKIVFAEQDPEIATKISKAFGEREIKEYQKGLSYGANDIRDGVNLTLQTRQQPLISPSAIQFLKKNQAYVRLPGSLPVTQIKLKIAKI
jgi:type IV conjugative transfer system coupling protein TraD